VHGHELGARALADEGPVLAAVRALVHALVPSRVDGLRRLRVDRHRSVDHLVERHPAPRRATAGALEDEAAQGGEEGLRIRRVDHEP